jgi:hypothetical protein
MVEDAVEEIMNGCIENVTCSQSHGTHCNGYNHGRLPVELFGVSTDKKCRGNEVSWGKRINAGRAPRSATTRPMDCVHTITAPISDPDRSDGETGHPSN